MQGGTLYMQAYPSPEKRRPDSESDNLTPHVEAILRRVPRGQAVDWDKVMELLRTGRALPVPIAPGSPGVDNIIEEVARGSEGPPEAASPVMGE
jgi:hypothetical protein